MKNLQTLIPQVSVISTFLPSYLSFKHNLDDLERIQRKVLDEITRELCDLNPQLMGVNNYEKFSQHIPVSTYQEWKVDIESSRKGLPHRLSNDIKSYEPTSGSTDLIKWIPYSKNFLQEFNASIAAWLFDTAKTYPKILNGKFYWSLSWLPPELRDERNNNDLKFFPWYQQLLYQSIFAVPENIQHAETRESSWWATLLYLLTCPELTLISVWSPTFLMAMIDDIKLHQKELGECLASGQWTRYKEELKKYKCPKSSSVAQILETETDPKILFKKIWPKLILISAWGSSSSAVFFEELKNLFPGVAFQEKGLIATEGVVSIPFEGNLLLSYTSHFYEFELADGNVIPAWELKKDMIVSPLITSGNGLLRYRLGDFIKIKDFHHKIPVIEFLYRDRTVDLVGEKFSLELAQKILDQVKEKYNCSPCCFLTQVQSSPPSYELVLVKDKSLSIYQEGIQDFTEELLLKSYHYKLARDLKQLSKVNLRIINSVQEFLTETFPNKIMGQIKIEPIMKI